MAGLSCSHEFAIASRRDTSWRTAQRNPSAVMFPRKSDSLQCIHLASLTPRHGPCCQSRGAHGPLQAGIQLRRITRRACSRHPRLARGAQNRVACVRAGSRSRALPDPAMAARPCALSLAREQDRPSPGQLFPRPAPGHVRHCRVRWRRRRRGAKPWAAQRNRIRGPAPGGKRNSRGAVRAMRSRVIAAARAQQTQG